MLENVAGKACMLWRQSIEHRYSELNSGGHKYYLLDRPSIMILR